MRYKNFYTIFLLFIVSIILIIKFKNKQSNQIMWEDIDNYDDDDDDDALEETEKTFVLEEDALDFNLTPNKSQITSRLFVTIVIIAPHSFEKRQSIRNTWGQGKFSVKFSVIFSVGISKNQTINKQIERESQKYQDILRINNYIDHYYNCTYKQMKTFKWIARHCSKVKYVLKICDDVVVNTPKLIADFAVRPYKSNHIFGYIYYSSPPIRNPFHKWYVPIDGFDGVYDPYPQGKIFLNSLS